MPQKGDQVLGDTWKSRVGREGENAYEREGESGSELRVLTAFPSAKGGRGIVNSSIFRDFQRSEGRREG